MKDWSVGSSPQSYARTGGALYLIVIVLGIVGEVIRDKLIVPGDSAATAANIKSMETLWRLGITSEFIGLISVAALAMVYFVLLKPVSEELNLLATFLRLIAIGVQAVSLVSLFTAIFPLTSPASLQAFAPEQLNSLASLAIRSHAYSYSVALFFFGSGFLVHGYLIFCSGFLPKIIGILIQVAGLCYLSNSLLLFVAPTVQARAFPAILLPCFVAESSLCLWLLFKGVNVPKWQELVAVKATQRVRSVSRPTVE
jgi:hypothetical protein